MSALYMSMSAQETDLEIEDDLAKGLLPDQSPEPWHSTYFSQHKRYSGT